ncbi:MAG: hypothetical protein WD049_01530 [Candidatus Paceibacterota bacterium]
MNPVGLSLHGQIHLTLTGASPYDVQAVMCASGAVRDSSEESPDVEVRFAGDTSTDVVWRHLDDAYSADGRFALRHSLFPSPVEIQLPTAPGPAPFRITYPSIARRRFPWLRSMINGKCVAKGLLGVHATAFTFEGRGYLVCGWPRGGKTGMLLAYLLHDARYLAAEWAYVSDAGQTMHGVPESLRLRDWHLRQGGSQLQHVGMRERIRLGARQGAATGMSRISRALETVLPRNGAPIRKLAAAVDRHRYVDRSVADWLGQEIGPRAAPIHIIVLVGTHAGSDIRITRLNAETAKRRLTALQDEDWDDLTLAYRRWAYAMPDPSEWLADFERKRRHLLDQLIVGKTIYAVDHPQEVGLAELFHNLERSVAEQCSQSR